MKTQSGPTVLRRQINVGVGLIVLQQNIVGRPIHLDQIVLEEQRVALCRCHRYLNIGNTRHQRHGLGRQARRPEVTGDPIFQVFRFADVEQIAVGIEHLIDPRASRQLSEIGFGVKGAHTQLGSTGEPITRGSISRETP